MALIIDPRQEPALVPLVVQFHPASYRWHAPTQAEVDSGECEEITFHLAPLTGADGQAILDVIRQGADKDGGVGRLGSAAAERAIRSVKRVEGIRGPDGGEITRMTRQLYAALPDWIASRIVVRVRELTAGEEIDGETAGNSEAPPAGS